MRGPAAPGLRRQWRAVAARPARRANTSATTAAARASARRRRSSASGWIRRRAPPRAFGRRGRRARTCAKAGPARARARRTRCNAAPCRPVDAGSMTASVNTCDSKGQLHVGAVRAAHARLHGKPARPPARAPGRSCAAAPCARTCRRIPATAGRCGHDCLGGGCVGAACQPFVLASNQADPYDIAIDTTNAYWVDQASTGTVNACALTRAATTPPPCWRRGRATPPASRSARGPYLLGEHRGGPQRRQCVMACATTGCASTPTPARHEPELADCDRRRRRRERVLDRVVRDHEVRDRPRALRPHSDLAAATSWSTAPTPTGRRWRGPSGVRSAGALVLPPRSPSNGQFSPWAIAADGSNVYWTTLSGHTVATSAPSGRQAAGGNPTEVSPATLPNDVAVDATNVYWVDFTVGTVSSCAIAGCSNTPTILASGQMQPQRLAVGHDWPSTGSTTATRAR